MPPAYRRVLLKISGEALAGSRGYGIDPETIARIAEHRRLACALDVTETQPAVELDRRVCERVSKAATKVLGHDIPHVISGALHDAAILAPLVPTAMLFVASRDGISHNPDEFSRTEDIAAAASVLAEAVRNRTLD